MRPTAFPRGSLSSSARSPTAPFAAVVGESAPRLLPGSIGAATHGLIRTGHTLRGLGHADTPPRRLEVANGLAFWASSYRELPGPPLLIGHEGVAELLADLPDLPDHAPCPFSDQ